MKYHARISAARLIASALFLSGIGTALGADPEYDAWKQAQIDDALTAAPPAVTNDATVYGWDKSGKMILLRHGRGMFSCVATGHSSTRFGKPRPPFPDPACYDPNSWAFFQAMWSEENPMKPKKPYPTAPGMVWMLAGMGVPGGVVRHGAMAEAQFEVNAQGKKVAQLSPHLMIMPLPVNGKKSQMPANYDPDNLMGSWVMAAETAIEHVMVHFSDEDVKSMMKWNQE